jgi:hypothetical protein
MLAARPRSTCRPIVPKSACLLLVAVVPTIAASCGQRPAASPAGGGTAPAEAVTPAEVLRKTREAMAALTSFEAHRYSATRFLPDGPTQVDIADYRFEPPDRHSFVVRGWVIGSDGKLGALTDGGEARQIGSSFWARSAAWDASAPWTCSVDDTRPDPMSYAPPLDALFLGEVKSSLGSWYRFRSEPRGSEWWIDATTYLVSRTESTNMTGSASEIVTYSLDSYNTPSQIVAPGPCLPAASDDEPEA